MDRDQLGARHQAAIERWWLQLRDAGGRAPTGLLDDLAAIASDHAATAGQPAQPAPTIKPAPANRATRKKPAP